ncbi:MAG: hypothetical protein ACOYB4_01235 [Methyloceanibacter sp.]
MPSLFRFAAFALLLLAAAPARADNLLTTEGAAARAVADIVAKIGREPSVSLIDIAPDGVTLQVQGKKDFHVDEWRWSVIDLWLFQRPFVSGPQPVTPSRPVDDVSMAFFPLAGVALDKVPEVAAAAIKRAALEDEAHVSRILIDRSVSIFPQASYGEPRWTVYVTSGREHASVYAAPDGTIIGADVSGTQRARMLDLLADDSHLDEAKADLAAVLGSDIRVREVDFSKTGISVLTEHPSKESYTISYLWNLNGVSRSPVDSMDVRGMVGKEDDVAFKFSELDFSVLPNLKKAALEKLKLDGGKIVRLKAERLVTGLRAPQLSWIVDVEDAEGEKGRVIADTSGTILEVIEPESRRPKLDWLAGSTIRATLDRIFAKFPKDTKFRTILINDERGNVEVEDPLKPGELASFIVDDTEITPFGTAFPDEFLDMGSGPPQRFTAEDMAGYDAATLDTLKQRTLERLGLKDGKIFRLTFERGNVFVPSPRGHVLVEIRADPPRGRNGGRVTYEPDGTELDVVMP